MRRPAARPRWRSRPSPRAGPARGRAPAPARRPAGPPSPGGRHRWRWRTRTAPARPARAGGAAARAGRARRGRGSRRGSGVSASATSASPPGTAAQRNTVRIRAAFSGVAPAVAPSSHSRPAPRSVPGPPRRGPWRGGSRRPGRGWRIGDRRDEGVPRAGAHALPDSVPDADQEHVPGRGGERDQGPTTVDRAYPASTSGLSRARRSASRPVAYLSRFETSSAAPSTSPMKAPLAPSEPGRRAGAGKMASLDASMSRLTRPSPTTVAGRWRGRGTEGLFRRARPGLADRAAASRSFGPSTSPLVPSRREVARQSTSVSRKASPAKTRRPAGRGRDLDDHRGSPGTRTAPPAPPPAPGPRRRAAPRLDPEVDPHGAPPAERAPVAPLHAPGGVAGRPSAPGRNHDVARGFTGSLPSHQA